MDLEIDVVNEVEVGDNLDRVWERWDGGRYAIKEGNGQLGLLCVWNNNNFQVDLRVSEKGFIMLGGVWLPDMQRVVVVNIYAPYDIVGKRRLWQDLSRRKMQS